MVRWLNRSGLVWGGLGLVTVFKSPAIKKFLMLELRRYSNILVKNDGSLDSKGPYMEPKISLEFSRSIVINIAFSLGSKKTSMTLMSSSRLTTMATPLESLVELQKRVKLPWMLWSR